jgi:trk system potassium uptake protein TrkA
VIIGAGEVGFNVASSLSVEGHDITIVESNEERAAKAENELDVMVVRGNGSRPPVLEKAGIFPGCDIDLLIACPNFDEVNIMACWIARRAGVKRVISRARGLEYTDSPTWAKQLGIDVMISPERSVAREIEEFLSISSAVHTAEFFGGKVGVYAFRVSDNSPLIGTSLRDLRRIYPKIKALVVFIERKGKGFVPFGEDKLETGDLCFTVTSKSQAQELEELFTRQKTPELKRVIVVGGGKIGYQVARRLEIRFPDLDIRLIDQDRDKCEKLSRELERAIVIHGDGMDEELLRYEGVDEADGFVTTTANDEHNILIGVVGKALGARKSVAVVRRELLMRLTDYMAVDAMVNPNQALATVIMRQVRYPYGTGALSIIDKIDAEVLELKIPHGSPVSGKKIMDLDLPKGILIALISRNGDMFVPWGDSVLMENDEVLIFAAEELMPRAVEMLGVE